MVIESTSLTKAYAKEFINVSVMVGSLIKRPGRLIKNNFIIWPIWFTIAGIWAVISLLFLIMHGNVILGIVFGALFGVAFIGFRTYYFCLKKLKSIMDADRHITYSLDGNGFVYDNHDNKVMTVYWKDYQCIRVLKNGAYLIPKDESGFAFGIQKEFYDQVKDFLKENNIDIKEI